MSKVIVSVGKKKFFFLQEPLEAAYNNPLKETDYKKKSSQVAPLHNDLPVRSENAGMSLYIITPAMLFEEQNSMAE